MTNEFVLRRARDADSIALSQLAQQTFRETYIEDLAIPYPEHVVESYFRSSKTPEWYANKIADPLRAVWVIEDKTSNELVAFLIACQCDVPHADVDLDKDGEIEYLYVRGDRQSHGLGKRLMNEALSWLEERHAGRPIWLATMSCNLKAQKYYAHYGFTRVGEYSKNIGEYEQQEMIMRRENTLS